MSVVHDLAGRRFGRLLVVARSGSDHRHRALWLCRCDCGTEKVLAGGVLLGDRAKSCGCLRRELPTRVFRTHGGYASDEYRIWGHIKTRCFNPKSKFYARYGGRGITMHSTWRNSFEAFMRDVGPRPSPEHSIDRWPNNDGNYEPGNVRWATRHEQANNKSVVRLIEHNGITDSMSGWARRTGVPYLKLRRRLVDGWAVAAALITACAAPNAAGIKRQAEGELEMCINTQVIVNANTREGCVDDALQMCNSSRFGPNLCDRGELIQHTQLMYFRRMPDAGVK